MIIRIIIIAVSGTAFFPSCRSEPERPTLNIPPPPEPVITARVYTVMDFKDKSEGGFIPEWASLWLAQGNRGVETEKDFQGRFVFVYSNEGNNFRALELLNENFTPGQDFPRLAAARIEARFSDGVSYPDVEYGAFFEDLIRAASDTIWTGAVRVDDFWVRKKYQPSEEGETESWELLILVTIEKLRFTSQLEDIFQKIAPNPAPTMEQIAAANSVKEHFYEGF